MTQIRACGVLAMLALSGVALASSHIVDIAWSPDGRFAHKTQIAAGKFVAARISPIRAARALALRSPLMITPPS